MKVYKVVQIVGTDMCSAVLGPDNSASVGYALNKESKAVLPGTPLFAFDALDNACDFAYDIFQSVQRRVRHVGIVQCEAQRSLWKPYQLPRRKRLSVAEYWERVWMSSFGSFFDIEPLPGGTVLCYSITPRKVMKVMYSNGLDTIISEPFYQGLWE